MKKALTARWATVSCPWVMAKTGSLTLLPWVTGQLCERRTAEASSSRIPVTLLGAPAVGQMPAFLSTYMPPDTPTGRQHRYFGASGLNGKMQVREVTPYEGHNALRGAHRPQA